MTAVNYLWNPINDNIVEEFDDAGNTIAEYTTEPDQFGDVISQYRDGQESFYHTDGQGSTLALTNSNGDVTDTYAYSAFGEVTTRTGSTVNPFQYIGQKGYYRDLETGEYDVRRRPLTGQRGEWLSADDLIGVGYDHKYVYAENSPTRKIDPSGLLSISVADGSDLKVGCGGTSLITYDYRLARAAPCDGYIVQMMSMRCKLSACTDCPTSARDVPLSGSPDLRYFEAWFVKKGGYYYEKRDKQDALNKFTDLSLASLPDMTCGYVNHTATAKFFCKSVTDDLGDLDRNPFPSNGWLIGQTYLKGPCEAGGGRIPTTDKEPTWWTNNPTEGPVHRIYTAVHICCPCLDSGTIIRADPS